MYRRLVAIGCLLAALVGAADAQTSRRALLFGGPPNWVLSGASIDLDFANGRYFGCTPATCLSITRASNKTNLLPSSASGFTYTTFGSNVLAITPGAGLLIEEARTNQLLNSTAPATQTTGALAATAQTLWVNGSGSAALSNGTATACTGTATNGTPVSFTPTAGTCTVTVTGSLNAFQLEAGAFGTSFIVTAGAAGTRAADNISAAGPLITALSATSMWEISQTNNVANFAAGSGAVIWTSAGTFTRLIQASNTASNIANTFNGSTTLSVTAASGNFLGAAKVGVTGDGSGRSVAFNNTLASDAGVIGAAQAAYQIGSLDGSTRVIDGLLTRMTVGSPKISGSLLQSRTQ